MPQGQSGRGGGQAGRVWVLGADGKPIAVAIRLGISDGNSTEVAGGELKEGQEVLVGTLAAGSAAPRSSGAPSQPPPQQTGPRMRL